MRTVVIGLGSPRRGDDAVGLLAVRQLEAHRQEGILDGSDLEIIAAGLPGFSLLQMWEGFEKAVLVDAVSGLKSEKGAVVRIEEEMLPRVKKGLFSLHGFGVTEAVALGRELGSEKMPEELVVIGVEIGSGAPSEEGLSEPVKAALPRLITAVKREISRC